MLAISLPDSLGPYAVLLAIGFLVGWYGHGAKNNWLIAFGIVLILTAIVVGVATTALGLALVVRIRDAYGTVEDDEIQAQENDL